MAWIRKSEEQVYHAVLSGMLWIDDQGGVWRGNRRAEHAARGYLQVRVMVNRVRHHASAHRLVWRHLNGPIPDGMTVNHKNGIKTDNRPENLDLATPSEQQRHALHVLKVGRTDQRGNRNAMAKLTPEAVESIRARRAKGERLRSIAKDFGVTDRTISKIALGQRWTG